MATFAASAWNAKRPDHRQRASGFRSIHAGLVCYVERTAHGARRLGIDVRVPGPDLAGKLDRMTKDSWSCPKCHRVFTQVNQRHACGTGSREEVLRDRPAGLVHLFESIEAYARTLGPVEIVTRQRYALFRSVRIFADLTVMTSCIRLVIHLRRRVADPVFSKIVTGEQMAVSHVVKLTTSGEWEVVKSYFEEAYRVSL